jgi:hypothetical protein
MKQSTFAFLTVALSLAAIPSGFADTPAVAADFD